MQKSSELSQAESEPLWRKVLPFVFAVALIGFVLSRLDLPTFLRVIQRVNYWALAAFAVTFLFALLMTDSFATREVYRRAVAQVDFKSLVTLRAASYLPSLLNHHVGQAWLTYFLSKVYGAPLWRVAGATLMVYATIIGGLILIASVAVPFKIAAIPWLAPSLGMLLLLGIIYLAILRARPKFLRDRQVTAPLVEVGVRGHLMLLLYRVPHLMVLFVGNWIPFELCGVHIPPEDALILIPVIMLVSALPITPQGLGTRDALALQLFTRFAPGTLSEKTAAVATATLSFAVSVTLVQVIIAPLFMARAQKLLAGKPTQPDLSPRA
jgi:uncharacterized membrane protein YbhN (UPF0104 family)